MKTILILGAGRSSASLISYLSKEAAIYDWRILIGDADIRAARTRLVHSPNVQVIEFNIHEKELALKVISTADVVISLLPPMYHPEVAFYCITCRKHLVTASYVSPEMGRFHKDALENDLLFLNECGLDPGIDHMTAMHLIDRIKKENGTVISFESFTGGLIAPETDPENPWRYKFTWNPRNVVMAGQGTAKFMDHGEYKYLAYQQLFKITTHVHVPGYGDFEGYANRDSLSYIDAYGLKDIQTMLRGTLRFRGFCEAWNVLVQLGCCDDTFKMENVGTMTHYDFLNSFVAGVKGSLEERIRTQLELPPNNRALNALRWSGFFDKEPIGLDEGTPARILEHILNKKWQLNEGDKDMIVMWHRFRYKKKNEVYELQASLVVKGENEIHTAMAKTVGWPLGIAAKLLLQNKIQQRGVVIPVSSEVYAPILGELSALGIRMEEHNSF